MAVIDDEIFKKSGVKIAQKLEIYFDHSVALFKSLSCEIDTSLLVTRFKSVLLPDADPVIYAQQILDSGIKFVIIPGLAFDKQGHRLGRGGGYYDRCLKILRQAISPPKIIGLCLKQQILEEIPVEPHDQKVDQVLSE